MPEVGDGVRGGGFFFYEKRLSWICCATAGLHNDPDNTTFHIILKLNKSRCITNNKGVSHVLNSCSSIVYGSVYSPSTA